MLKISKQVSHQKKRTFYFPLYTGSLTFFNIGILIIHISLGCIKPQTNQGPVIHCSGCHTKTSPPLPVGWPASARCVARSGGGALLPFLGVMNSGLGPTLTKHLRGFVGLKNGPLTQNHNRYNSNILLFINQIRANGWRL